MIPTFRKGLFLLSPLF